MKTKLLLLLLPFIGLMYSCDSLSEGTEKRAERIKKNIGTTKITVKKNDSLYKVYLKGLGDVAKYDQKERLGNYFNDANKSINSADKYYKDYITPLLENDESKDEGNVIVRLNTVDEMIASAIKSSEYPKKRMTLLKSIDSKSESYRRGVNDKLKTSDALLEDLKKYSGPFKKRFPKRKADIEKIVNGGDKYLSRMTVLVDSVNANVDKKKGGYPYNLTVVANAYREVNSLSSKVNKHSLNTKKKLRELDKSYSKTLKDMKVRYFVQVGRTSWDSHSDANTDTNHLYSVREVDEQTFKYFDGLAATTVLANELSFGTNDISVKINKGMWNKLRINPTENYPSGDDDSEFWINNTIVKYYHNYVVENNGKVIEQSQWSQVNEDTFYDNLENLGMTIYSKPLGYFESEAITEAAPAGMVYVGNPKYGEWKKDSNGETFWSFYGKYMFFSHLLGGHRYSMFEYDDYRRNYRGKHRPYYGSRGKHSFGTRGSTYTKTKAYRSSNYQKSYASNTRSEFNRNNLRKNYRSQTASRRSGSSRRGGGPGGGGK